MPILWILIIVIKRHLGMRMFCRFHLKARSQQTLKHFFSQIALSVCVSHIITSLWCVYEHFQKRHVNWEVGCPCHLTVLCTESIQEQYSKLASCENKLSLGLLVVQKKKSLRKNVLISRGGLKVASGISAMELSLSILGYSLFKVWKLALVQIPQIHLLFGYLKPNKILITLWVLVHGFLSKLNFKWA